MKSLSFLLFLLFSSITFAHPVIYKDGLVYWGSMTPSMSKHRISYTFHPRSSVEINTSKVNNFDNFKDYTFGLNVLIKRWLQQDSQGNIYFGVHGGYFQQRSKEGFVGHGMLMGDWESRSIYTAGSVMNYFLDGKSYQSYSYRIGFAPYIANMNTLQAWMILKFDYFKEDSRNLLLTPMMRFFYKNTLWEMGANTNGEFLLTLMTHY